MHVIDFLKDQASSFVTFEVLPPVKGKSIKVLYDILDPLMEFSPPFVNVTYHGPEYEFKELEGGYYKRIKTRKRPGTVAISAALKNRYPVEPVPHLTVGGLSRERLEDMLIDLNYLEIDNILIIRGDPGKTENRFKPHPRGHSHAIDLVRQVADMNQGVYLDNALKKHHSTNFSMGVAGYPEKHQESPNFQADIKYLKQKIEAGADYIVTQMFFDNQHYYNFVKACREAGIQAPIVPGLKPLTRRKHLNLMPEVFNTSIPAELSQAVDKAKNDAHIKEIGKEWTTAQSRELLKFGVPSIHYYTMSRLDPVADIARAVF